MTEHNAILQTLIDFNRQYQVDFDTFTHSLISSDDDPYPRNFYDFGYITDTKKGVAELSVHATRRVLPIGICLMTGDSPGVTDTFHEAKRSSFFRIGDVANGLRTFTNIGSSFVPASVYTSKLAEEGIARYLDHPIKLQSLAEVAISNSQGKIDRIYTTCATRGYKSGWAWHKLMELVSSVEFQKPFLDAFYYADPKRIVRPLWEKFLKQYRPKEFAFISAERADNIIDRFGFGSF